MPDTITVMRDKEGQEWVSQEDYERIRRELDGIYAVVEHSDTALYSAVKHSKKRVTGSA